MNLIFIFIDGVGLGSDQPLNPFACTKTPGLDSVLEKRPLYSSATGYSGPHASLLGLDCSLGIEGFPQSATGQASIFTGENAAALLGSHMNGFPDERLRELLAARGLFKQLKESGYKVSFVNAYRPEFFEMLKKGLPGNNYSCSTLITYYGCLQFKDLDCLRRGKAVYMDITNELLFIQGYDVSLIDPETGADNLVKLSNGFHFCMFEYFLSDLVGHSANMADAQNEVKKLDRFIGRLHEKVNFNDTFVIISSDHGNMEDLSTKEHTMNQVPALLIGSRKIRNSLETGLKDITDILPAIRKVLAYSDAKG